MDETESEVARIRQQIDAEREAAQRGLFGLAYGVSRHDFITYRMEVVADEVFLKSSIERMSLSPKMGTVVPISGNQFRP